MIVGQIKKRPQITFGLGATSASVKANDPITIYVNSVYVESEYDLQVLAPGADIETVNRYQYVLTYFATGTKEIQVEASHKTNPNISKSNKLILNVI